MTKTPRLKFTKIIQIESMFSLVLTYWDQRFFLTFCNQHGEWEEGGKRRNCVNEFYEFLDSLLGDKTVFQEKNNKENKITIMNSFFNDSEHSYENNLLRFKIE